MASSDREKIGIILSKTCQSNGKIIELFKKYFGHLDYTDEYGNTILHLVANYQRYNDVTTKYTALLALLENKVDPCKLNSLDNSFIHLLIGDEKYNILVFKLTISAAIKCGFDINTYNKYGQTLLYYGLMHYPYDSLLKFIDILDEYNFNLWKEVFSYEPLEELVLPSVSVSRENMIAIRNKLNSLQEKWASQNTDENIANNSKKRRRPILNEYENNNFKKYCTILTEQEFTYPPAYDRDAEVEELIYALSEDNKGALIVGPSGCGKTTIVEQLAYLIQNDMVPKFLRNQVIVEASINDLVAGTTYRGDFEKRVKEILELCVKSGAILFIDEIHGMYGAGISGKDKDNDLATIMKPYIDRQGLKVIGTTTDVEYQKFMAGTAMKRRFDVVRIKEPDDVSLIDIGTNIMIDIANKKNISLEEINDNLEDVLEILVELTSERHRKYDDKEGNPSLLKQIISKSFAYPIVQDRDYLTLNDVIRSINSNERIYDSAKAAAAYKLNQLKEKKYIARRKTNNIIEFSAYLEK